MPLPLTTAARNAIAERNIAHAWLIDLYTDEGTLRGWDKPFDISYESVTYEGLSDAWEIGEIQLGTELVPQPLSFVFDGNEQNDNSSFVGRLVDRTWHQRRIRLRGLLLEPGSGFLTPIGTHLEWNGFMDSLETLEQVDGVSNLVLQCEGGLFRSLDRNMTTCSHTDQQRRDATDNFFRNTAIKPTQDVPFGTSWSNIPGGRSGGGGGSSGIGRLLFR